MFHASLIIILKLKDINECAENSSICQYGTDCINLIGSYNCTSKCKEPGYSYINGTCTSKYKNYKISWVVRYRLIIIISLF